MIDLIERPEWMARGNCLGVDPELFYPERGASGADAKAVCRGCSVQEDCLNHALDYPEKFGIWGGLSERERRRIRRKRPVLTRRCQWAPCQAPFVPANGSQVYHSPACAEAARSARRVPSRRVG